MAKALDQNGSDGEGRKLGEQRGLDKPFLRKKAFAERTGSKHPRSPSCKRCPLDIGNLTGVASAVAKALSGPPGEYGRKAET